MCNNKNASIRTQMKRNKKIEPNQTKLCVNNFIFYPHSSVLQPIQILYNGQHIGISYSKHYMLSDIILGHSLLDSLSSLCKIISDQVFLHNMYFLWMYSYVHKFGQITIQISYDKDTNSAP